MDSLTQGLLGAATFALIKDKDIGKKSLLIGAIAGTVPDLDVLLAPFFNNIAFLTIHRSISHSIGFAVLMSFLLGELFHRWYDRKHTRSSWNWAFFLAIFTHSILDWFTTYGTKLISPFSGHLFSLNSIHVFEPMYTLTLLIGILFYACRSNINSKRSRPLLHCLYLSTFYLMIGLLSKHHAYYHFRTQALANEIEFEDILVSPTPMNVFLWHGIVKQDSGYHFGTYSIFDKTKEIEYHYIKSDNSIIPKIADNRLIKYYLDYTQGFPLIDKQADGDVKIYAIKYGPINYFGKPQFVYPLSFNENDLSDDHIKIDYSTIKRGPISNYNNLFRRIKGI